ncbi:hypothetical protein EV363DRAFT_30838 [Boletus edulis]|nr:hypothetical protein EV363DRAFT_30838 [Boletus edulis]
MFTISVSHRNRTDRAVQRSRPGGWLYGVADKKIIGPGERRATRQDPGWPRLPQTHVPCREDTLIENRSVFHDESATLRVSPLMADRVVLLPKRINITYGRVGSQLIKCIYRYSKVECVLVAAPLDDIYAQDGKIVVARERHGRRSLSAEAEVSYIMTDASPLSKRLGMGAPAATRVTSLTDLQQRARRCHDCHHNRTMSRSFSSCHHGPAERFKHVQISKFTHTFMYRHPSTGRSGMNRP